MKKLYSVLVIFIWSNSLAQVLTPETFIDLVRKNHPLAKQAGIIVKKADADLLSAKGGFDPMIGMDASRKTFDGKNYYYYTNPQLKIPTWIGADIKAGIENNGGQLLSSEITAGQTSYLGLEVPVARGLLIDKRRATLQQAKIYRELSEQEQLAMLNNLLFEAYQIYWQWAGNYQLYSIYSRFVSIAQDRLRLVKIGFENGERASIDTIEALTQVQQFQLNQTEALLQLTNTTLELSNYLWDDRDGIFLLSPSYVPDTTRFLQFIEMANPDELIQQALTINPTIKSYDYKINALEVDRRLKQQNILPYVNLKANFLNSGYNMFKGLSSQLLQNNYAWGIDIKFPLFLREGKGEYRKSILKVKEANYERSLKRREVENKVRSYLNESDLLKQQLILTQKNYSNFQSLLNAEYLRFRNGESSLFLVNNRENKVIESAEKLISFRIKYLKSRYAVDWAAGILR